MKNFIFSILVALLVSSCNESVTISKEEYNKLKGDTFKPEYPKTVNIINAPKFADTEFVVYLGSDGHEYQKHKESHVLDQWSHYADCKKCNLRDSVIFSYLQYLTH